ncbi:hypothetical protein SAMN02745898_101246 [Streptomyces sp. 136MFCol5.1]|jgi:hypothetical protein|nr:hypothetical protein SAMN02745898_101246 [Streptomyces sp. 136MFCol5.1]
MSLTRCRREGMPAHKSVELLERTKSQNMRSSGSSEQLLDRGVPEWRAASRRRLESEWGETGAAPPAAPTSASPTRGCAGQLLRPQQ